MGLQDDALWDPQYRGLSQSNDATYQEFACDTFCAQASVKTHSQLPEESAFQISTNEVDLRVCFDKANAREIRSGASWMIDEVRSKLSIDRAGAGKTRLCGRLTLDPETVRIPS